MPRNCRVATPALFQLPAMPSGAVKWSLNHAASARGERILPHLFISHSSKDDLAAEAMRIHLVERGWNRKEIFLDFSVEGISAHEQWKASLAEANSGANALLCLASPDWLASMESQVERRVAETFKQLDPQRSHAVFVAILRDLNLDQLRAKGFGEQQIVDLSAAGESTADPCRPCRDVPVNRGDTTTSSSITRRWKRSSARFA